MEKLFLKQSSYFQNNFLFYKNQLIQEKLNEKKKISPNLLIKKLQFHRYFFQHIENPNLFLWGFFTYNVTNLTGVIKLFNLIKEKNYGLGETVENILKTNKIKEMNFNNLYKFLSNSFFSINGLVFRPGILIPKGFIYFLGIFQFNFSERKTFSDLIYLFFSSFILSIPFYWQFDKFFLEKLKKSRIDQKNINLKNLYKYRIISNSLYAFIDNFLLNLIFFGCVDLFKSFNQKKGLEITYDKKKLEVVKKTAEENETLGRVVNLYNSFVKRDYYNINLIDYFFAGFITTIIYTPIETIFFVIRKNLFDKKLFLKNFENVNEDSKMINIVLLTKFFRLNIFRILICNSLNSLLIIKSIEK